MEAKPRNIFTVKKMTLMAMFIALQIILSRFVGLQLTEGFRISFEIIPILLGGLWLGPVHGAIIGFVSDILGTLISGYGVYFPPLSLTPIINGVLPCLIIRYIWKVKGSRRISAPKCAVTIVITELISSFLIGTLALTWYYDLFVPSKNGTFAVLFVMRLPKLITLACDTAIVTYLHTVLYKRLGLSKIYNKG